MKKLFVAGHNGMVGSSICRLNKDYELVTVPKEKVNLENQKDVDDFLKNSKPDIVVICAAKVGGIHANNTYPAEFIYKNLMIQSNIINSSYTNNVERLLFLGSSCIYPKYAPQPIKEDCLLTSSLEPTNEAYAIAKIAGLKMCQFYRKQYGVLFHSAMPTNLYGVNDNYHPENSHVIPGLIRKIHEAKIKNLDEFQIWGSGKPKREFLFVDDLAKICFELLKLKNPPDWINIGSNTELTILELAQKISNIIGYKGKIKTGDSKIDGTPRKKLNCSLLNSIIKIDETEFDIGLQIAYNDFLKKI
jgi:GDP-L-fucose synthase